MRRTNEATPAGPIEPTAPADAGQAADLAALTRQAAEIDATGSPGEPVSQEPAAPAIDLAAELSGLVGAIVPMLAPAFPRVAAIYTDETTARAAGAVAAVCNKRGWLQGGVMGEWAEEITAAAILIPLAVATVTAAKQDNADRARVSPAGPAPASIEPAAEVAPLGGSGFESAIRAATSADQ